MIDCLVIRCGTLLMAHPLRIEARSHEIDLLTRPRQIYGGESLDEGSSRKRGARKEADNTDYCKLPIVRKEGERRRERKK